MIFHGIDGPNRNRWFTELKNGGSFHGKLLNNQMVTAYRAYGQLMPVVFEGFAVENWWIWSTFMIIMIWI